MSILGQSIVAARNFIKCIHVQSALLMESLDSLMDGQKWTPLLDKVSDGIGPQYNPEHWLVRYLYRDYSPDKGDMTWYMYFIIWLDPPASGHFAEPVCLALVARFGTPQSYDAVHKNWNDDLPLFEAMHGRNELTALASKDYHHALPNATSVSALVVPLCELHCEDDLRTRIVDPLLAARAHM